MRVKRSLAVFGLLCGLTALAAACGGGDEDPTRVPTPVFSPTPAPAAEATSAPAPTATVAAEPPATEPPAAEATATPTPTATPAGDAANGEKLFAANGCNACHSTGSIQIVGPGLAGVFERAAARVAGMSAGEYIEQSIRDPGAFVVDGFLAGVMPATFGGLPAGDIQDLIAYLATLK